MKNIIKFENVTKSFGDLTVLNKLNLEVKDGEKLALIGPSGSGKTTLMEALCGLRHISSGSIILDNREITQLRPGERRPGDLRVRRGAVLARVSAGPRGSKDGVGAPRDPRRSPELEPGSQASWSHGLSALSAGVGAHARATRHDDLPLSAARHGAGH